MSFFDSASLVQIPSGVKDGVLYSVKPIDGSGDLTFSRGSDIEATRVNANGYIEKAQVNLLTYSNDFNGANWTLTGLTATSGQADKDGGTDAWKLEATSSVVRLVQLNSTSGVQTFSVYAKAGNVDIIRFQTQNGGTDIFFNVSNGTIVSAPDPKIDATIVSAGNGFYRCTLTYNETLAEIRILPQASAFSVSSGDYIYLQDAQLNYGLVAQTYQETTTAAVVSGITDNMPRLNYDPANPTCPSLLLEPSRQNILANDTYIANTFAFDNCTASYNNSISPEGVQNALLLTQTGSVATNSIYNFSLPTTAGDYAYSFFFKAGTSTKCRIYTHDSVLGILEDFNPQTITAGKTGGDLDLNFEDYGNDWWRVSFTRSIASGATYHRFWFYPDRNNTNGNVSLYGFQIESGSYSSSLIPTYGSSATRTADACSKTGIASLIGQSEGTIFIQVESNEHISELSDGTSTNRIVFYTDGSEYLRNLIRSGGSTSSNIQTNTTIQAGDKIALAYANNDSVIYKNGLQIGSDTSVTVPATSKVNVGSDYNGNSSTINSVNQFIVFPTRLTNAQLAELTA